MGFVQAWQDVVYFGFCSLSAIVRGWQASLNFCNSSCSFVFQSAAFPGLVFFKSPNIAKPRPFPEMHWYGLQIRTTTWKTLSCDKKRLANLFIISGCNGAGKTTASFTILPELLKIKEFVNADEIARGLSPFQPEKVSIEAGKIMLRRLKKLLSQNEDFAFETTLSSRSFIGLIKQAKEQG